jgi:general secretion pathway protein H
LPCGGFTLIEMLVVIVLAGILISVVSISVTPDPRQKLMREAQRIGQLMTLAADEARIRQLPIVWEADLRGYRFVADVGGERQLLTGDDLLRERTWDTPLTRLSVQDGAGPQPAQVLLGPGAPPVRMAIAR